MPAPVHPERPHDQAEELLSWYATGRLDAADRLMVDDHLASCARCRRQVDAERLLVDAYRTLDLQVDSRWARLRARVEQQPRRPWRPVGVLGELRRILGRPAVVALATAQLAFLVLAGTALLWLTQPNYRALGGPQTAPSANVLVIFRADATEDDIRTTLRANDATLVGGPTPADAYLLHVPARQRDSAVKRLQADDDVQLAEAIDGAGL